MISRTVKRLSLKTAIQWNRGNRLQKGTSIPHDLLAIKGADAVQRYILQEVQKVYRLQGVHISDKHIELIIRQMLRKRRVDDTEDSAMLPGSVIDKFEFRRKNQNVIDKGNTPATSDQILLGITKASLATSSFLSAASFQENDACLNGRCDQREDRSAYRTEREHHHW